MFIEASNSGVSFQTSALDYVEYREFIRVPMISPVVLIAEDRTSSRTVRLVDISPGGARIGLAEGEVAPQRFYLLVQGANKSSECLLCEKRWQVGEAFGAQFVNVLSDDVFCGIIQAEYPDNDENFSIS